MKTANLNCEQIQQECLLDPRTLQSTSRQSQGRSRPHLEAQSSVSFEKQQQAVKSLAPFIRAVMLPPEDSRFVQHLATLTQLSKLSLTVPGATARVQQVKQALLLLTKLRSLSLHAECEVADLSGFCYCLSQLSSLRELSVSTTGVHRRVYACIDQLTYIGHGTGVVFDQAPKALQQAHYELLAGEHLPLLETLPQPVALTINSFHSYALQALPKTLQEISLIKDFANVDGIERLDLQDTFMKLRQLRILRINCFPSEVLISFKGTCLPELHTFGFSMPAEKGRRTFPGNKWLQDKCGPNARRLVIPPRQMEFFKEIMPCVKTLEFIDRKEGCLSINMPHVMDGWFLTCFPALTCIRIRLTTYLWQFCNMPSEYLVRWD